MHFRKYIGAVITSGNKIFIMRNEKSEWILPRVKVEGFNCEVEEIEDMFVSEFNLQAIFNKIVDDTQYEFFSLTKKAPMCNAVFWYHADSNDLSFTIKKSSKIEDGGFYDINIALDKITYSQEKNTVLKALNYLEYRAKQRDELA